MLCEVKDNICSQLIKSRKTQERNSNCEKESNGNSRDKNTVSEI